MDRRVQMVMAYLKRIGRRGRNQWMFTVVCVRLARQFRLLRIERGLTKKQLADLAGLHYTSISRLENRLGLGMRHVTINTLIRIAAALDVGLECRFISFLQFAQEIVEPVKGCKSFTREVADGEF